MSIFFPYKPRKFQDDIIGAVSETLQGGKHLVLESATGSGKTISVLAPALEYAIKNNKKLVYLTRTNAQQRQVLIELRKIREHLKESSEDSEKSCSFYGLGLQGRQSMCLLVKEDDMFSGGTADELGKLCRDRKNRTIEQMNCQAENGSGGAACRYFAGTRTCNADELTEWFRDALPFAEEFLEYCREHGICAHELNKELASGAVLVVAPYVYFFDNFLRISLLDWLGCAVEDIIVIVDEAHNLPEFARSLRSSELSRFSLEAARKEAEEFDNPEALKNVKCTDFCDEARRILLDIEKEYVRDEDGLIPPDEFESELMYAFSVPSNKLVSAAENLIVIGETIRERRRIAGKLPRSYIHSLGAFLFFWLKLDGEKYVKLVVGGDNPRLEGYCLDPSLATDILNACHSSVHMSGTLRPLEEYRDSVGLPKDSAMRFFPPPFPEKNLGVFYMKDITTKYETLPKMIPKIRSVVTDIANGTTRNTAFFFPSFDVMKNFASIQAKSRTLVLEDRGLSQSELLGRVSRFKESAGKKYGAALFAVSGGRLSEGLDFPDKELEVVVVVGIPYPKPSARQTVLQHYYDLKFNKGWEYTVQAPTARKLLQCIGRMIRSDRDRGVAIILDHRAVNFKDFLRNLREAGDPVKEIADFFI